MKRAGLNATVEALWEHLLVERSVLTPAELAQLRSARAGAHAQGTPLTLEAQLHAMFGARLEPLRNELRARARSCARCQTPFLASPPHGLCPSCGQPGVGQQSVSSSGILAPQRPNEGAYSPQSPSAGSGAYPLVPGSGAFPAPGTGAFPAPGTGAFPAPGTGAFTAAGYPPHLQNSLLHSQGFRSTSSNSRPSGSKSHSGPSTPGQGKGLQQGDHVGNYVIVDELGRGGMGAVYRVQNAAGQIQALKVLHSLTGSKQARFRTEIEIMAKLSHPNVIQVHDSGLIGEYPYYVMDYVEGSDLKELIKQRALEPREGVKLLTQVIRAVGYAHTCGVLHRDLKPGNIIVDKSHVRSYVLDFGLAKIVNSDGNLTREGSALGTPYYMPPELAAGRHDVVDGRADVYSLGVILYELLAGTPPFTAASTNELMRKIAKERPATLRTLGVPTALDRVAQRALAKNPEKRYPNAEAMAAELEQWLHAPEPTVPLGVKLVSGAMASLVLVLAVVLVSMLMGEAEPEPDDSSPPPEVATVDPTPEPPQPEPPPAKPPVEPPPRDPDTPPPPTPPLARPPEVSLPSTPRVRTAPPAQVGLKPDPLKPIPERFGTAGVKSPIAKTTSIHLGLDATQTSISFNLQVPAGVGAVWVYTRGAQEDVDLYLRQGSGLSTPREADLVARSAARDENLQWSSEGGPLPLEPGPYRLVVHRPRPRGEPARISIIIRFLKPNRIQNLADVRGLDLGLRGDQAALLKCVEAYAQGDTDEALRAFPLLASEVPQAEVVRAHWLLDMQRYDEAREVAEAVLEHEAGNPRAAYVVAACDFAAGDYGPAAERAMAVLRAQPNLYEPLLVYTRALLRQGEGKRASTIAVAAYKQDPSRMALGGLTLLGVHDEGQADAWEKFVEWFNGPSLDVETMRIMIEELLQRDRAQFALDFLVKRKPSWKGDAPFTLTLCEARALAALKRGPEARALLAELEPKLRLPEHAARVAAIRAGLAQLDPNDPAQPVDPEQPGR